MFRAIGLMVLLALLTGTGLAQDAEKTEPAVDLTDAAAVGNAYMAALDRGDISSVMKLVSLDAMTKGNLQSMLTDANANARLPEVIAVTSVLPFKIPGTKRTLAAECKVEGDTAEMTMHSSTQGQLVLARQKDGTWLVDLEETVRRITGGTQSFLLAQSRRTGPGGSQGMWELRQKLSQIGSRLNAYAQAHGDMLPAAGSWMDDVELFALDRSLFDLPEIDGKKPGVALCADAAGAQLSQDWRARRGIAVLYVTSEFERNACGDLMEEIAAHADREEGVTILTAEMQAVTAPPGMTLSDLTRHWDHVETCQQNVRVLTQALRDYARAHDGCLPPADSWCQAVTEFIAPEQLNQSLFHCPERPELTCAYAINAKLAGKDIREFAQQNRTVLLLPAEQGVLNEARAVPDVADEGWHINRWDQDQTMTANLGMLNGDNGSVREGSPYPKPDERLGD